MNTKFSTVVTTLAILFVSICVLSLFLPKSTPTPIDTLISALTIKTEDTKKTDKPEANDELELLKKNWSVNMAKQKEEFSKAEIYKRLYEEVEDFVRMYPDIRPLVNESLSDNVITNQEYEDIVSKVNDIKKAKEEAILNKEKELIRKRIKKAIGVPEELDPFN